MLTLAFEVLPKPGREGDYLDLAAQLRPALDASGGMQFLDRSRSRARAGWFLSHQVWRDEASMARWRCHGAHHRAQVCGRSDVLADYRLRVAQVIATVGADGDVIAKPIDNEAAYRVLAPGERPRLMASVLFRDALIVEVDGAETFDSVYDPMLRVMLADVASEAAGVSMLGKLAGERSLVAARLAVVSRDYGMFDRAEAPQYFDPVTLA